MKRHKDSIYLNLGVLVIFGAIPFFGVQGNPASSKGEQNVPMNERAVTLPTSDNMVYLQIIIDGQIIRAAQREGGLIRIMRDGKIHGITPHIRDANGNLVSVDIFRISKIVRNGEAVGEAIAIAQTLDVNKDIPTVPDATPNLSIQVEKIELIERDHKDEKNDATLLGKYKDVITQACCISCSNTSACACYVSLSCGDCCNGTCCPNVK